MDSKELTKVIYNALDDKKGENIKWNIKSNTKTALPTAAAYTA